MKQPIVLFINILYLFHRSSILIHSFVITKKATTTHLITRSTNEHLVSVVSNTKMKHKNKMNKNVLYASESNYQRLTETSTTKEKDPRPFPKIGDVVRYYELDGGKVDGQILVGKISFIQQRNSENGYDAPEFLIDIAELDDLGNGYYTEYSGRKRQSKRSTQKLQSIAPIRASYVRSEDAFKVPLDINGAPKPYVQSYNYEDYQGPIPIEVDEELVQSDGEKYNELKSQLLRDTALTGLLGIILAQLFKGTEDAIIYAAGAIASIGYLYFLTVKTDTVASPTAKLGSNVANVRFVLPVIVLLLVALRNAFFQSNHDLLVQPLSVVTSEQFASAMIGFLTYRVPLFTRQISKSIDIGSVLPGSAAIAYQASKEMNEKKKNNILDEEGKQLQQRTMFLISGPLCAGKTTLVNKLLDDDVRFIKPYVIDRLVNEAKIELLQKQDAILSFIDGTSSSSSGGDRYALTQESLLNSYPNQQQEEDNDDKNNDGHKVLLVDASVELAQKLLPIAIRNNINVIGVWVSLDSMEKFESRLKAQITTEKIPYDETPDTLLRGRTRNVIRDIEYGIVSGIFDFTILNDDLDESWKQLKDASEYCFK